MGSRNSKVSNWETILLTCRSCDYESNAIWMGQNGVKMNILWPKESQWQFCKQWKRIFN